MTPEPRRPGQSNADYNNAAGGRRSVSAKFQGTNSLQGGGDPSWMKSMVHAVASVPSKLRARRSKKQRAHRS